MTYIDPVDGLTKPIPQIDPNIAPPPTTWQPGPGSPTDAEGASRPLTNPLIGRPVTPADQPAALDVPNRPILAPDPADQQRAMDAATARAQVETMAQERATRALGDPRARAQITRLKPRNAGGHAGVDMWPASTASKDEYRKKKKGRGEVSTRSRFARSDRPARVSKR